MRLRSGKSRRSFDSLTQNQNAAIKSGLLFSLSTLRKFFIGARWCRNKPVGAEPLSALLVSGPRTLPRARCWGHRGIPRNTENQQKKFSHYCKRIIPIFAIMKIFYVFVWETKASLRGITIAPKVVESVAEGGKAK